MRTSPKFHLIVTMPRDVEYSIGFDTYEAAKAEAKELFMTRLGYINQIDVFDSSVRKFRLIDLGFSVRATNLLFKYDLTTVGEMIMFHELKGFHLIKQCGSKTYNEIADVLAEYGYEMRKYPFKLSKG